MLTLNLLPVGETAIIEKITTDESMKQRLWDLGFTNGTKVQAIQKSPSGDPIAYRVRGTVIAIRNKDAKNIILRGKNDD